MPTHVSPRRLAVAACASAAMAGSLLLGGGVAHAAAPMTITGFNVHRLPATTANQVLTVTGTNFDQDTISTVAINGCTAGVATVVTPTTFVFKTDATCATTSTGVLTLTPVSGAAVVTTNAAKTALTFVNAPSIADNKGTAGNFPVITANTAGQTTPTMTASTSGGTAIRVTKGAVAFVNSTAFPLSAAIDGKKLTNVVMHTGGDYFTGVLPALAADAAPSLTVTSNGVSKTFNYHAASSSSPTADSFAFQIAGVSIAVTPAFGPMDGGTSGVYGVVVKGTGFTASTVVTFGSATAVCDTVHVKATSISCTAPAASTDGPVTVQATTGGVSSVISAGSTYTYVS